MATLRRISGAHDIISSRRRGPFSSTRGVVCQSREVWVWASHNPEPKFPGSLGTSPETDAAAATSTGRLRAGARQPARIDHRVRSRHRRPEDHARVQEHAHGHGEVLGDINGERRDHRGDRQGHRHHHGAQSSRCTARSRRAARRTVDAAFDGQHRRRHHPEEPGHRRRREVRRTRARR